MACCSVSELQASISNCGVIPVGTGEAIFLSARVSSQVDEIKVRLSLKLGRISWA